MIGRIVHYVLDAGSNVGDHRPAIVVNVLSGGKIALTVFCDAARDGLGITFSRLECYESQMMEPGTWHWPERSGEHGAGSREYPKPVELSKERGEGRGESSELQTPGSAPVS